MTREPLDPRRAHESLEIACGGFVFQVGLGRFEDGRLAEVFLQAGKDGTHIAIMAVETGVLVSLLLQYGCPVDQIAKSMPVDEAGAPLGLVGQLLKVVG